MTYIRLDRLSLPIRLKKIQKPWVLHTTNMDEGKENSLTTDCIPNVTVAIYLAHIQVHQGDNTDIPM